MFAASKTASVSGGYQISRSLRYNSPDSTYLTRTFPSAGNRKTWTMSFWVKKGFTNTTEKGLFQQYSANTDAGFLYSSFATGGNVDKLQIGGGATTWRVTTQVFRDPSAWYHLVFAIDTTQATADNRIRLYVNGTEITAFDTKNNPTQNSDLGFNNNVQAYFGSLGTAYYFDGYFTEVNFIDGSQLTPSSFGETNAQTGVWQPKAYSGSYGTNGFYLNFSDNSNTTAATLGKDYSGNGNNWTPNNFSVTAGSGNDSLVDSPTSYGTDTGAGGTVRGNYATLNAVFVPTTSGVTNPTLANGNLNFVGNLSTDTSGRSTIGMTSGTWYAEVTISYVSAIQDGVGIAYTQSDSSRTFGVLYRTNGNKLINNTATTYGSSYAAGDVIGIAVDATNNQVTFYKNGTSQGAISFTPTTEIYFSTYGTNASPAFAGDINFGQRPFAYTAPSGYKALCTQNLPTPTIGATTATQAGKYFNAVTWTGDSTNPRTFTGVGFQPDFVWTKGKSIASSNVLYDVVRGVSSGNATGLVTNNTDSEANFYTVNGGVTAFTSDGFTSSGGSTNLNLNYSGYTFVAWNWKANGSGSTNTSGSITSTVSANTTSGFSIVTFAAAASSTVGHGLGVAPSMVVVKSRTVAGNYWLTYHVSTGATGYLAWNTTDAFTVNSTVWANTAPTSSVFTIGSGFTNASYGNCVAYCFAEVAGYSKFGSYTGNGSSDGPFVYCGFRPAYVMIKLSSSGATADWIVEDGTRNPYNVANAKLSPNTSGAEYVSSTDVGIDFLSNGFKIRGTDGSVNTANTYIFAAFATAPFKYSLAR